MNCPHGINIKHKRCYQCEDIAKAEMRIEQIPAARERLLREGYLVIKPIRHKKK